MPLDAKFLFEDFEADSASEAALAVVNGVEAGVVVVAVVNGVEAGVVVVVQRGRSCGRRCERRIY